MLRFSRYQPSIIINTEKYGVITFTSNYTFQIGFYPLNKVVKDTLKKDVCALIAIRLLWIVWNSNRPIQMNNAWNGG